jgi:hypothetical protein
MSQENVETVRILESLVGLNWQTDHLVCQYPSSSPVNAHYLRG